MVLPSEPSRGILQPCRPQPAFFKGVAAAQLTAVVAGYTPYVKSQKRLLTCKHETAISVICRMAEELVTNF